jgi:hypothetical protein
MDQSANKYQHHIISFEAGLVVMLIKVALEQANIHTMSISWISLLLSILFCVDILRRTKRASYPECGRLRFTVGLGVILAVFVSFGAFICIYWRSAAESAAGVGASRHTIPAHDLQLIAETRPPAINTPSRTSKSKRKPQLSLKAVDPTRPEPTMSETETPVHPCQTNIVIGPAASDTTFTNNLVVTPCTAFVETSGVRTLVSNNRIIQYPPHSQK